MLGIKPEKNKINGNSDEELNNAPKITPKAPKNNSNIVVGLIIGVFVVVGGMVAYTKFSKPKKEPVAVQPTVTVPETKENKEESPTKPGLPNLNSDIPGKNTKKLSEYSDYVKDLQNKDVKVDFTVKRIKTVLDFVNYTKQRAVSANGLEMYWLEAIYKDRPYRVQVPFQIWKELDEKGITVVDIEVLQLASDSEIVSYMSVRPDYKKLLEKGNH